MEFESFELKKTNDLTVALVVDLDGTLVKTDSLVEMIVLVCKYNPFNLIKIIYWLVKGPAILKEKITRISQLRVDLLPYRMDFLEYINREADKGRRVILATGAHREFAEAVASHLDIFDEIIATENGHNIKGESKLQALHNMNVYKYSYAGDSRIDIPVWKSAASAILVGVDRRLTKEVERLTLIDAKFDNKFEMKYWLKAVRFHQWLKNLLIFIPMLTAFAFFDVLKIWTALLAFVAFSFCASATYIFNDILDLESDRLHYKKRNRPFASGQISIEKGVVVSVCMLLISLFLGFAISKNFGLVMIGYLLLTVLYTLFLKSKMIIDVLALSMLYTVRIVAGSVATDIKISRWLLTFSTFSFLALALVKRCAELMRKNGNDSEIILPGRGYKPKDLNVLYPFGVGASLAAIVVYCLFINAPETLVNYGANNILWFAALGFVYLFMRLWIKTVRGEMNDDPVIHMLEDRGSILAAIFVFSIMMIAYVGGRF